MSCPNCNLVLNYAGSPRRFSSQELQDGKHPFNWNWPENPITTLVPTNGVLLEVCDRKKRCCAWSLDAMTSHIRTLSMLLLQDSTGTRITLFVQTRIIRPSNVGMPSTPNQVHSLLLAYYRAMPLLLHKRVSGIHPFLLAK
jgi:hypothetical protein